MRKIFLDTNFIIDYFIREDFTGDAEKLLQFGDNHHIKFYISYLSVANFAYIMRKLPSSQLNGIISQICTIFQIVDNTGNQILKNLNSDFKDFEDGLQYQSAIDANCDCIISRNKKDFINTGIPVLTATEFLKLVS